MAQATRGRPAAGRMSETELHRRYAYHPPDREHRERHDLVRAEFKAFAEHIDRMLVADSDAQLREVALFHTTLEQASMWAHAAIAREPGNNGS